MLRDLLRPQGLTGKSGSEGRISYNTHTHTKYLRFNFQGGTYQFNCLPLCLSWVFTKALKPPLPLLRGKGISLIAYIDDIQVVGESKEMILNQLTGMLYLLECLGFIINKDKSILVPSQSRISGSDNRLSHNGDETLTPKIKQI